MDYSNADIRGEQYNDVFKHIDFNFNVCEVGGCANTTEITKWIKNSVVTMHIQSSFFDFNDLTDPVRKYLIKTQTFRPILFLSSEETTNGMQGIEQEITYKIRKNEYNINNDNFSGIGNSENDQKFFSVRDKDSEILPFSSPTLLTIRFEPDSTIEQFEASTESIIDLFGTIGGIFEVLVVTSSFILGFFTTSMYYKEAIGNSTTAQDIFSYSTKANETNKLFKKDDF